MKFNSALYPILGSIKDFLKTLSPNTWSSLIVVAFLIIVILIINHKLKKQDPLKPPKGILVLVEWLVTWINSMCEETIGPKWKKYAPFILTLALFIFVSNIVGLFGLNSPTANIFITVSLGIMVAFVIQGTAIKEQGLKNYFKGFLQPSFLMLPLNIISEIVTPFSLGIRLFGNIFSGAVILGLIYGALGELWIHIASINIPIGYILSPIITPVFHAIFDIAFGAIQTYVFILLSTFFISSKMPENE